MYHQAQQLVRTCFPLAYDMLTKKPRLKRQELCFLGAIVAFMLRLKGVIVFDRNLLSL